MTGRIGGEFGIERSVPPGVLPYAAARLDASGALQAGEVRIAVEALNVDSASFTQIWHEVGQDPGRLRDRIRAIVAERGKMHNPVTGSGGVLVGTVTELAHDRTDLSVGDRLVTLVSLTTTPLSLTELGEVDPQRHQVRVKGDAILFARSLFARLPDDLPETLAMSVLDVCGAPAQAARLAKPGMRVAVLGAAGKSGTLVSWVAGQQVGPEGQVIGLVRDAREAERAGRVPGVTPVVADATDPLAVLQAVHAATGGALADLVFNCVNVPNTEMATILPLRQRGTAYFFSMATSFQAAALGAEAVGQDVDLLIGNGYAQGHAELALDLVRRHPALRALLEGP